MLINGQECNCYEEIPFVDLQTVPSENETITCSKRCNGADDYVCGGPESVSIYVASMPFWNMYDQFLYGLLFPFLSLK